MAPDCVRGRDVGTGSHGVFLFREGGRAFLRFWGCPHGFSGPAIVRVVAGCQFRSRDAANSRPSAISCRWRKMSSMTTEFRRGGMDDRCFISYSCTGLKLFRPALRNAGCSTRVFRTSYVRPAFPASRNQCADWGQANKRHFKTRWDALRSRRPWRPAGPSRRLGNGASGLNSRLAGPLALQG